MFVAAASVSIPEADRAHAVGGHAMHDAAYIEPTVTSDERTWGTFLHLGGLIAWFIIGPLCFLVPLIMWLVKKDDSQYLDDHGREALNFEISMLLYILLLIPVSIVTLGIGALLYIPVGLLGIIAPIVGAVAANKGRYYRYPMCIRFVSAPY